MANIAILGSGMAGYGAWHRLRDERHDVVLYEKNGWAGGHTTSWTFPPGFVFDEGPHVSFTKDERIQEIFADAIDGAFEEVQYQLNNYWRGHWLIHPVQTNLYGLPVELVTKVIADFVDEQSKPEDSVGNYDEWLVASYGRTFADEFPAAYTRKYHTTEPYNMTTDWIGPRMYRPSLEEVLRGALAPGSPNVHYVKGFRYPTSGGFRAYLERFIAAAPIECGYEATRIDTAHRTISFSNGNEVEYDHLISSVALPDLLAMISDVPRDVEDAVSRLACSTVVLVNVGVDRPDVSDVHISYFYDEDISFSRLCFPHLMSPNNAPEGTSSIQAEIYFSKKYRALEESPETFVETAVQDLIRCGLLAEEDRLLYKGATVCEYANIIFDHERAKALDTVHGFLDELGIARCGRYGDWGYMWTDDSFKSGERAAEETLERAGAGSARAGVAAD